MSTEPNQAKWVGIRLAAGETALPVEMTMDEIRDADNDTKVQTEEAGDEDKVRVDTGGIERVVVDSASLRTTIPIIVGDGAGQYLQLPTLTTAQRDALTAVNGMVIYNSTTGDIERYEDGAWSALTPAYFTKIRDADADTKVDVEESADEDKVRMDVAGVEAFHLDAAGILTLVKQSGAWAYLGTTQSIDNVTYTKIALDTELYDIQGEFDPTTNYRFTASVAGKYLVVGKIEWRDALDGKLLMVFIYKNGTAMLANRNIPGGGENIGIQVSGILSLAANDYIELYGYHNTGTALIVEGGLASETHMIITKIA